VLYAPLATSLPDETTVAFNTYASWTGWTLLGYTTTPTTFSYSYETFDVEVQQSASPIKSSKTNENLTIGFALAQFEGAILALVMDGSSNNTAASAGQKAFTEVKAGGDTELNNYMFAIEGYRTDTAGTKQPVRIFIHKGSLTMNGDIAFDKAGVTQIPCQVTALADSTKVIGEQLITVHIVTGPATTT